MPTYYVATRSRYVLVAAADEPAARVAAEPALHDLYADLRERLGRDVPIEVHTIRLATQDEVDLQRWHHELVAREAASSAG